MNVPGVTDIWLDDLVKHVAWGVVCAFLAWGWRMEHHNHRVIIDALGSTGYALELCKEDMAARLDSIEERTETYLEVYDDVLGRADR